MTAVESLERKKARVDEANTLLSQLDEVTQKAVYIATTMFLAKKDTVTAPETGAIMEDYTEKECISNE